jgi:hypothetical protein
MPTNAGLEKELPLFKEVAQKMLSDLPNTTLITPELSELTCGCCPFEIAVSDGGFHDLKKKGNKEQIISLYSLDMLL